MNTENTEALLFGTHAQPSVSGLVYIKSVYQFNLGVLFDKYVS